MLIVALGVGLRRYFEGLSAGNIYPVRFNAQIGENPALPILGVYDDRAENEAFWATGLGEMNSEYLLISSSDGEWTGDLTSGEFQPHLALPANAKLWQVFETGAIYSLPAGSLYGLKGQQTYLLNSLDGSEEYKSVLFDQAENLLFIIYQDQAGALRLKYVRPQGTEVEIYRFADAGYQLAAYDHTRQSLQVYYLGGDTYWQLNLITKELSESSSPLSSHLQVVPPAEQTYV
ncbi:hypothetical protein KC640_02705, partial [Candidatus Dojkabacteria bacterium]|nr:hypothetical protein [Candidatus Dojkabacteria bacterium]